MSATDSKRKRHSAFDDFPVENGAQEGTQHPAGTSSPQMSTLGESASSLVDRVVVERPQVERIERLKPSQMIPDRFQPRRLLPAALREPYFSAQIDCYQAAARWIVLARQDSGHQAEIDRLLAMGASFKDHGQIKPITGSWVSTPDGRYLFLIETGERRFWSVCLVAAASKLKEEPLLRVEVVSNPSRQRQVLENRHAEPPSAVGQACEIAALILAETGIAPSAGLGDEYDYFRAARSQRMPAGLWDKIKPVMQLTRPRMVQLLNLLQFPTALLEMADRYRLPERVLREVLALPAEQWERMIVLSIQNQLTSDEVVELSAANPQTHGQKNTPLPSSASRKPPALIAASGLRRFANSLRRLDEVNQAQAFDELADEMVVSGDAENLLVLLEELSALMLARLTRR